MSFFALNIIPWYEGLSIPPENFFGAGTLTSGYQNNHFWPYFGLGAKVKVPYLRYGKTDHPDFWYAVIGHPYEYTYRVSLI